MASIIDICNRALSRLGIDAPIGDLEAASKEARACKLWYPHARDVLLESFSWPFAKRLVTLSQLTAVTPTDWEYAYQLPNEALSIRGLYAGMRFAFPDARIEFEVQAHPTGSGRILVTDASADVVLIYTRTVTETGNFSPLFTDALVFGLAKELAMALRVDASIAGAATKAYEMACLRAKAASLKESWSTPTVSELISVRG